MQNRLKLTVVTLFTGIFLMGTLAGCDGNSSDKPKSKLLGEHPAGDHRAALKAQIEMPDKLYERSTVTLNGDTSFVRDGTVTAYDWHINMRGYQGGQIAFKQNQHTAELVIGELAMSETLTISLKITADNGKTHTSSRFVTIEEIDHAALPELPKERDESLLGIDVDFDGVRDDIEIAIYKRFPLDIEKRELSRFAAKSYNDLLNFGLTDGQQNISEYATKLATITQCYRSSGIFVGEEGQKAMQFLQALVLNTHERDAAAKLYEDKLAGNMPSAVTVSNESCRLPQN